MHALAAAACAAFVAVDASAAVDTRLQPIYHTPGAGSKGYAGDPNGLMYRTDTDLYHFFWQRAAVWPGGGMTWGHATSTDFVRWKRLPEALGVGSFSGGATLVAARGHAVIAA
jgi:sucrose-6-phosphate hydrolase SacC (GH32 family)